MSEPNADREITSRFDLELDGIARMGFERCVIPAQEWTTIERRTGTDDLTVQKSSGLRKSANLLCTKELRVGGTDEVFDLLDWFGAGSKDRRSGAIVQRNRDGVEIMRWNFTDGWISKHDEIELDASADSEPVMFRFELAVSKLEPQQA